MADRMKKGIAEQVKALTEQINSGVKSVFQSDNFRDYLLFMSKFHHYSARNCLLIRAQAPYATRVAGFNTWKSEFHRYVRKGEHGIHILAYSPHKRPLTPEDRAPDNEPKRDEADETEYVIVPSYIPVYVFDVSQTDGEPLPELAKELTDTVEQFQTLFTALDHVSPFPIQIASMPSEAKGVCDYGAQSITIQPMSEAQTLKTAIHEVAHARCHNGGELDRATKEVQAESVAFVVSSYYGLDTSDYSFPYIAGWSSTRELPELLASLDTIQAAAHAMITEIDVQMAELLRAPTMERQGTHHPPEAQPSARQELTKDPPAKKTPLTGAISAPVVSSPPKSAKTTQQLKQRPIHDVVADAKRRAEERAAGRVQDPPPEVLAPGERR